MIRHSIREMPRLEKQYHIFTTDFSDKTKHTGKELKDTKLQATKLQLLLICMEP